MATGSGGGTRTLAHAPTPGECLPSQPTPQHGLVHTHPLVQEPRHTLPAPSEQAHTLHCTLHACTLRPHPAAYSHPGVNVGEQLHSPSNGLYSAPNPGAEVSGTPARIHTHLRHTDSHLNIFSHLANSHMFLYTTTSIPNTTRSPALSHALSLCAQPAILPLQLHSCPLQPINIFLSSRLGVC